MTDKHDEAADVGPLGPGHAPTKDPMKGLRGVMSGILVLEAITIFLALTVILKIDDGALWTPFNIGFVVVLGTAHVVMAFLQRVPYALQINLGLQVVGLLGFFVHWSVGLIVVIYFLVWWYMLTLRRNLLERMRRGLLVTQHLDKK